MAFSRCWASASSNSGPASGRDLGSRPSFSASLMAFLRSAEVDLPARVGSIPRLRRERSEGVSLGRAERRSAVRSSSAAPKPEL